MSGSNDGGGGRAVWNAGQPAAGRRHFNGAYALQAPRSWMMALCPSSLALVPITHARVIVVQANAASRQCYQRCKTHSKVSSMTDKHS